MNLAVWFALHTWFRKAVQVQAARVSFDIPVSSSLDPWALALLTAAVLAIFRLKIGIIPILLACAGDGIVLHLLGAAPWLET